VNVDPDRYFSTGSNRKLFLGGVQPRVGASYSLDDEGRTAVFGSFGIFYDRLPFNATLDETYRRQHPIYTINFTAAGDANSLAWDTTYFSRAGLNQLVASQSQRSEVYLIPNDLKPPRSNQWSLGLRQNFGNFNGTVTYNGTRSYNGYSYEWANQRFNPATNDCCQSVATPAYQNILVGNNEVRTWYDALLLQLDKPYRNLGNGFGWGAGISWTLAKADQEGNDLFSFPQVRAYGNARHPIADDRYQTIVANWITDVPYLFGVQFSGIAQLASGTPYAKTQFVPLPNGAGNQRVILGRQRSEWFKNLDLRLRKDFFNLSGNRAGVTGSVFNVINTQNLGCRDETYANAGTTPGSVVLNRNYGSASCTISDPRRFQLGLTYDF
jgi:hypothetical protein